MKKIGMIGGLSWHSTILYYRYINEAVNQRLGQQHSANIILQSMDMETVLQPAQANDNAAVIKTIADAIASISAASADFYLICSNTAHIFVEEITSNISLPFLSIGEVISDCVAACKLKTVALLGTRALMQSDYYANCLAKKNITLLTPSVSDQEYVDHIIFSELVKGVPTSDSCMELQAIIARLKVAGAEAVILGCTELPMLLSDLDQTIPLLDSLRLHALAAVDKAFFIDSI